MSDDRTVLEDERHFHIDHSDGIPRLCDGEPCIRSDMAYWILAAVGPSSVRLREDLAIAQRARVVDRASSTSVRNEWFTLGWDSCQAYILGDAS